MDAAPPHARVVALACPSVSATILPAWMAACCVGLCCIIAPCAHASAGRIPRDPVMLANGMPVYKLASRTGRIASIGINFHQGLSFGDPAPMTDALLLEAVHRGRFPWKDDLQSLGGVWSISIGADYAGIILDAPHRHWARLMRIAGRVLEETDFDQHVLMAAKKGKMQAIQQTKDDPERALFRTIYTRYFPNHPYGYTFAQEQPFVQDVTVEDIQKRWRDFFCRGACSAVVCISEQDGDVYPVLEDTMGRIRLHAGDPVRPPLPGTDSSSGICFVKGITRQTQCVLVYAWDDLTEQDRDMLALLSAALNGMDGLLFRTFRSEEGAAYHQEASRAYLLNRTLWWIRVGTRSGNYAKIFRRMDGMIYDLCSAPISDGALALAKKRMRTHLYRTLESDRGRIRYYRLRLIRDGRMVDPEEYLARFEGASAADLHVHMQKLFQQQDADSRFVLK